MTHRASIRGWLFAVALLASLPLLGFALYSVYELGQTRQTALTAELTGRTEATASAVRQQLDAGVGYLSALATSEAATRDDIPELYAHAQRVAKAHPEARAFTLIAPDRRMSFLTLVPLGTRGLVGSDPEALETVFATGKPAASGAFKSPVSDRMVTTVGVPVLRDGRVAYCLRMVLLTDTLNQLLAAQKLPPGWVATVIDARGRVVARSRDAARFIGREVSASVMAQVRAGRQGVFEAVSLDGQRVTTSLVPVPGWQWKVAVSVPFAEFESRIYRSMMPLALVGVVFLMMAFLAADRVSRRIAEQVGWVLATSRSMERGEDPPLHTVTISELADLEHSLRSVGAREHEAQSQLTDLVLQHERVAAELSQARADVLTGLPGRAVFLERVERMHAALDTEPGRRVALLFVDLDGFKAVNDRLGHEQGDLVLVRTAEILRSLIRGDDMAARLGGDEFVVCLTAPSDAIEVSARAVAARLVEEVSGIGSGIGCSVGVAVWTDLCPDLASVMRRADEAMYEAKRRGKNRFVLYDEGAASGHVTTA